MKTISFLKILIVDLDKQPLLYHEGTLLCCDLINYEVNVFSATAAWCYASCRSADTHRKSPPETTRLANVTVAPMILIQGIFICWKSTFQSRFDRTYEDCFKNASEDVAHDDYCKMTPVWHTVQCPGLNQLPSQPHFPLKSTLISVYITPLIHWWWFTAYKIIFIPSASVENHKLLIPSKFFTYVALVLSFFYCMVTLLEQYFPG